jgi:hypothetical protein
MQKYVFEIGGRIDADENSKVDLTAGIIRDLNEHDPAAQIQKELAAKFKEGQYGKVEKIEVELQFEKGSILLFGIVAFHVMEVTVTVVEFTKIATLLVKMITEKVIRRHIQRQPLPGSYQSSVQVTPAITPPTSGSSSIFDDLSFKIVKWLTIVNIVFFVGGNRRHRGSGSIGDGPIPASQTDTGRNQGQVCRQGAGTAPDRRAVGLYAGQRNIGHEQGVGQRPDQGGQRHRAILDRDRPDGRRNQCAIVRCGQGEANYRFGR